MSYNNILDIYNTPISQKSHASHEMSKLNFQINNGSFVSNISWCRFSYSICDSFNYALHSHSFFELHYCIQGSAVFYLKSGEEIQLNQNEFLIFPSKVKHGLISMSDDFEKFVIGFDMEIKDSEEQSFFKSAFEDEIALKNYAVTEEMKYAVAMIFKKIINKDSAYNLSINELLTFIITEIAKTVNAEKNFKPINYNRTDNRLEALIRFIKDNIYTDLHIEDFAREMNLSSKQINRLMKAEYGMSVSEFFRVEKNNKIKEILSTTDMSLSEIAKKFHFSDEYSMSKSFKAIAGITPGSYRRNYHK